MRTIELRLSTGGRFWWEEHGTDPTEMTVGELADAFEAMVLDGVEFTVHNIPRMHADI